MAGNEGEVAVAGGPGEQQQQRRRAVVASGPVASVIEDVEYGPQGAVVRLEVGEVAGVEDVVPAARHPPEGVVEQRERVVVDASGRDPAIGSLVSGPTPGGSVSQSVTMETTAKTGDPPPPPSPQVSWAELSNLQILQHIPRSLGADVGVSEVGGEGGDGEVADVGIAVALGAVVEDAAAAEERTAGGAARLDVAGAEHVEAHLDRVRGIIISARNGIVGALEVSDVGGRRPAERRPPQPDGRYTDDAVCARSSSGG